MVNGFRAPVSGEGDLDDAGDDETDAVRSSESWLPDALVSNGCVGLSDVDGSTS